MIEGGDGVGKSTLARNLANNLRDRGSVVTETKEPRGERRERLLNADIELSDIATLLLFMEDRLDNIENVIRPALKRNEVVICDRGQLSTIAYQHYGTKLSLSLINELGLAVEGECTPDLIIYLYCPDPSLALSRVGGADRFEKRDSGFQERVRLGYRDAAASYTGRLEYIRVTADMSAEDVLMRALDIIIKRDSGKSLFS